MTPSHHARVLTLAAGAAFLALLDVTVVNLAIPALGRAYPGTSVNSLSWVITAYATTFAALLAPAGRLADIVGRRALYRVGVGGFAALSLVCALSPSVPVLLVARALQGAFAATMIPASLAILLADTPAERRATSVALWSASGAFAAAVGPSVGGVLVDAFGWRSLFVINVPAGLALAAAAGILPRTARARTRLPDAFGSALLALGIGLAALGLSQGSVWGWGDPRTIASLAGGVAGIVGAVQRSWRTPVPAIETALWKHRPFALANAASFLYGASLYAWMLLGVLVLTELWHYSELQAGLAMTPGAIAASLSAVAAGRRATPRTAVAVGAALMAASGLFIAATLPTHGEFLTYWLPIGLVLGRRHGHGDHRHLHRRRPLGPAAVLRGGHGPEPDRAADRRRAGRGHAGHAGALRRQRPGGDVHPRLRVLLAGGDRRGAGGAGAGAAPDHGRRGAAAAPADAGSAPVAAAPAG